MTATLTGQPAVPTQPAVARVRGYGLLFVGVVLIAVNLRLVVGATGPLLTWLESSLHLSAWAASLLTMLWPIGFAVAGIFGPTLARRLGVGTALTASVVVLAVGSAVRAVPSVAALLLGSLLAAVGIGVANVLLPVATRRYFPARIGVVTSVYGTAIGIGSAVAALIAVPVARGVGSASTGMLAWVPVALLTLVIWLAGGPARRGVAAAAGPMAAGGHVPLASLLRDRLAWAMAALFGLQSMIAYALMGWLPTLLQSDGMTESSAGSALSVVLFVGIPLTLTVPALATRTRDRRPLMVGFGLVYLVGLVGLLVAPASLAFLWAVLLGCGMAVFPVVLALIGVLGGSHGGTAALSAFTQSVGYVLAATAPLCFGLLHDATGTWTISLVGLVVTATLLTLVGTYVASPRRAPIGGGRP
jgi:CP family cyanate transporter-like MFS transporter